MRIVTLNVRGVTSPDKRRTLFHWATRNKIDILCLQETFCTLGSQESFDSDWCGNTYHCLSDSPHSRGVSILINENFKYKELNCHKSQDGRRLLLNFEYETETFCLVSAYAPNNEKDRIKFFKKLSSWISQHTLNEHGTFLTGDFNCALSVLDRLNNLTDKSNTHLSNTLKHLNLEDSFRKINPNSKQYTYNNADYTRQSRIDYIFSPICLYGNIKNTYIKPVPKIPDHKAVILDLSIGTKRGNGFWKLNVKWLNNDTYKNNVIQIINSIEKQYNSFSADIIWDICKVKIKVFSIKFAIASSKVKQKKK